MQLLSDSVQSEKHHPQEARLKEKCREHFVSHKRTNNRPGPFGKYRPVGAELVRHYQTRNDAHAERNGEDLHPVFEQIHIQLAARLQPERFEHCQIARQPDRKHRKYDMERNCEGELHSRQEDSIKIHDFDVLWFSSL